MGYRSYAGKIYKVYRNSLVHAWNLFEATLFPGDQGIQMTDDTLSFGLLNFLDALEAGVEDFLSELGTKPQLQKNTLARYRKLKRTAKP